MRAYVVSQQVEVINWGLLSVGTNFRFSTHAHGPCCELMIWKTRASSWPTSSISDFWRTKRIVKSTTCSRLPVCKYLKNNYFCGLLMRCVAEIEIEAAKQEYYSSWSNLKLWHSDWRVGFKRGQMGWTQRNRGKRLTVGQITRFCMVKHVKVIWKKVSILRGKKSKMKWKKDKLKYHMYISIDTLSCHASVGVLGVACLVWFEMVLRLN